MRILFLGYPQCLLLSHLQCKYNVAHTQAPLTLADVRGYDFSISFGYKHIIGPSVINFFEDKIVNLHISFLPHNRGYHPNFWSFRDRSPKGVSIHQIDSGIDTGPILLQKEIFFENSSLTLRETHHLLIKEIQELFIENCEDLINNRLTPQPQTNKGTFHLQKEIDQYQHLLPQAWDTPVSNLCHE